eukprot:COSAG02_NODE_27202_length_615_cov_0.815891_1_plen_40_part_01
MLRVGNLNEIVIVIASVQPLGAAEPQAARLLINRLHPFTS